MTEPFMTEPSMNKPALMGHYRLQAAQQYFGQSPEQLDISQQQWLERTVERQWQLEERILASPEARVLSISRQEIESSASQLRQNYANPRDFTVDLMACGITEQEWRGLIGRQLLVEKVMAKVADEFGPVDEAEVRNWYDRYPEKFIQPEQRQAFHLMITVNPDFPENQHDSVSKKIEQLRLELQPQRFDELARRHSECPTALRGGEIGWVVAGVLFPELDVVLFGLRENQLSQPVETDMGFHLLYCKAIRPSVKSDFQYVAGPIRAELQKRRIKQRQQQWLACLLRG